MDGGTLIKWMAAHTDPMVAGCVLIPVFPAHYAALTRLLLSLRQADRQIIRVNSVDKLSDFR